MIPIPAMLFTKYVSQTIPIFEKKSLGYVRLSFIFELKNRRECPTATINIMAIFI